MSSMVMQVQSRQLVNEPRREKTTWSDTNPVCTVTEMGISRNMGNIGFKEIPWSENKGADRTADLRLYFAYAEILFVCFFSDSNNAML